MVECLTDDRGRAQAAIRDAFRCNGGRLGACGSVAYLFNEVGLLRFPPGTAREPLSGFAWQAGAEDVIVQAAGALEVLTDPLELERVRTALADAGFAPQSSRVTRRAQARVRLAGAQAAALARLVAALGHLEGVASVYTNAEIAGEVLASV